MTEIIEFFYIIVHLIFCTVKFLIKLIKKSKNLMIILLKIIFYYAVIYEILKVPYQLLESFFYSSSTVEDIRIYFCENIRPHLESELYLESWIFISLTTVGSTLFITCYICEIIYGHIRRFFKRLFKRLYEIYYYLRYYFFVW